MSTPITLVDETGIERFRGTTSGGGLHVQANYSCGPINCGNNAFTPLSFATLDAGTGLLDRTSPTAPTLLAAGTYALSAQVQTGDTLSPGGYFVVNASIGGSTVPQPVSAGGDGAAVIIAKGAAGDNVVLGLANNDGVNTLHVGLVNATLVRLD